MHIITTLEDIRTERELREHRAARRAATLNPKLEYHASGNYVARFENNQELMIVGCESHWDACLVLLALPE